MTDDQLVRDLVALGRGADVPAPSDDLANLVLARVSAEPRRTPGWWTQQRRIVALVVTAILLALLAAPPVRAAVADLFDFGGVRVEIGDSDHESAPPPPSVSGQAQVSVGFPVYALADLGEPDGVEVSDDRRIVSMTWTTDEYGVVRLDQIDGRIDYTIAKQVPDVSFVTVGGNDGLWFDDPHELTVVGEDGTALTAEPRLAGHTLVWQSGDTTLRLEGDLDVGTATEIAESAEPLG